MPTQSTPSPSIPWHHRLEARVAAGVTLLVGLSLGALLIATTEAVTTRSLSRASEDLEVARAAFYRSLDSRTESAVALTRLVTELPVFRAHINEAQLSSDPATITAMADGYRRQLNAHFTIVTDADGKWLGSPAWPAAAAPPRSLQAAIESAVSGTPRRDIVPVDERLFLVVSEPARFGEEVLGTMTVGYALDDTVAEELAQATRCDVNLVSGNRLAASSLRGPKRAALAAVLAGADGAAPFGLSTGVKTIGGDRYVEGTFPLMKDRPFDPARSSGVAQGRPAEPFNHLILLQDWRPTQQFRDELLRQFFGAGALVFGFALAGGLLFSRRMSRPLREIAAAAKDIAAGNWARQVPIAGSAEATVVAAAFNEMTTSLRLAQERLLHDAFHDHLTQLPNRALFMDRLQRAITRRTRHREYIFAVLFVDLDRFKTVNDSLGHPAGDRLLLEIARRLTGALRRDDTVSRPLVAPQDHADDTLARVGGDEFTILLEDIRNPSDAVRIAERIQQAVAAPILLDTQEVFVTASVGIAISGAVSCAGDDLLRDADIAMYRAKAAGGDRCAVFDATMHEHAVERLQLETDLRRAVERQEFQLQYQPIVSLTDHRIVGFEALIRWQHPEQGLLSPVSFLKVAEETGLIARIDQWVLREACVQARRWHDESPDEAPISVSVNLSAQAFGQQDLVRQVSETLRETGLDPRGLRLEITESVAMADAERARTVLVELKALGVRISLDDFGTGYSSLSYLQGFPVDTLKIDRSFVIGTDRNDECREIIRTIVNLARTLRLDVIAEGAETAAQVEFLEGLECRYLQGYFFSRPMAIDQLSALFSATADKRGALASTTPHPRSA